MKSKTLAIIGAVVVVVSLGFGIFSTVQTIGLKGELATITDKVDEMNLKYIETSTKTNLVHHNLGQVMSDLDMYGEATGFPFNYKTMMDDE